MSQENVFATEWRECLREHYKNVVRNDPNPRNLESVRKAFLRPNGERPAIFGEDELHQLYIEATMRSDEMPDGFVPDLELLAAMEATEAAEAAAGQPGEALQSVSSDERTFQAHPLECQCPDCMQINLVPHNDEGLPLDQDALAQQEDEARFYAKKNNEPAPTQLSLF